MSKTKGWVDNRYGSGTSVWIGSLRLDVYWSGDAFRVKYGDAKLVKSFDTIDEAKRYGLALAKKKLSEALNQVQSLEEEV